MKRIQLLAALFMTQLVMGCCCGSSFVVDSCDPCYSPCYNPCQPHCCGLIGAIKSLWPFGCCRYGCGSCYSPMYSEFPSSCSSCGCGGSSYGGVMMGSPTGSSCGCGGGGATMMAPTSVPPVTNPQPTPADPTNAPVPQVSPSEATGMAPMTSNPAMQHVSYEEFQKLPGTVTSGPGMTAAPQANTVAIPAPVAPTASAPMIQKSIGSTQRFIPRSVVSSAPLTAQAKPQMWVPAH